MILVEYCGQRKSEEVRRWWPSQRSVLGVGAGPGSEHSLRLEIRLPHKCGGQKTHVSNFGGSSASGRSTALFGLRPTCWNRQNDSGFGEVGGGQYRLKLLDRA